MTACLCGVDVHDHVAPRDFPRYLPQPDLLGWPSMAPARHCHRHVMMDGRTYRPVSDKCGNPARRLIDMDETGLERQVLSPMPELFSYCLDPAPGAELARYVNDQIAVLDRSVGRRLGLAGVPFNFHDSTPVERIPAAVPDPAVQQALLRDNACHFLGLEA